MRFENFFIRFPGKKTRFLEMCANSYSRDPRLCYHTRNKEYLISALKDGFWPRYCPEDYSALFGDHLGEQFWFAAPIVCFTDMRQDANADHRKTYGEYSIAIAKDAVPEYDINPLIYVVPGTFVAEQIVQIFRPGRVGRVDLSAANPLMRLLPFIKVTPNSQIDRTPGLIRETWLTMPMEDEMEWRYIPNDPDLPLLPDVRESNNVSAAVRDLSNKRRLKIPEDLITDVIVPTRADAKYVMRECPTLASKVCVRGSGLLGWLKNLALR